MRILTTHNRSELAKSLKAYCKNHFSTGVSSVSCSQYPLLPPQPEADVPTAAPAESDAVAKSETAEAAIDKPDELVTDVVPEQVGSGEKEPAPTPAVGDAPKEEVAEEGGLDQLDEDLKEVKVEDGEAVPEAESTAGPDDAVTADEPVNTEAKEGENTPQVTEEETKVPVEAEKTAASPAAPPAPAAVPEPKKQERVENPVYTLEIAGTKYNPSNFWYAR